MSSGANIASERCRRH